MLSVLPATVTSTLATQAWAEQPEPKWPQTTAALTLARRPIPMVPVLTAHSCVVPATPRGPILMSPVPAKPNALRLVQHGAGEPAVAMAEPTVAIAGAVQTAPPTTAPFLRKSRLLWLDMMHPFS